MGQEKDGNPRVKCTPGAAAGRHIANDFLNIPRNLSGRTLLLVGGILRTDGHVHCGERSYSSYSRTPSVRVFGAGRVSPWCPDTAVWHRIICPRPQIKSRISR